MMTPTFQELFFIFIVFAVHDRVDHDPAYRGSLTVTEYVQVPEQSANKKPTTNNLETLVSRSASQHSKDLRYQV